MQSYHSTKFQNGLTLDKVEPGPNALADTSAVRRTFLRPPTLTASNFEALEIEYLLYRYGVGHNPLLWRNWLHHLLSADMHRNYNIKSHLHLQIFYNSSNE